MDKIKFGTDGWRAIMGDEFTFANVRLVTQAIADYVGERGTILVGHDTRFLAKTSPSRRQSPIGNGIPVEIAKGCPHSRPGPCRPAAGVPGRPHVHGKPQPAKV